MEANKDNQVFRVFISHKHEDHQLAVITKTALQNLSGKINVKCFVSGVDIPAGTNWKKVIKRELQHSNLLLLLFTNPTKDWDWCLYEAGLFTRFEKDEVTSVVCIHNPDGTQPAPLTNLQGIPAQTGTVESFLKTLFKGTSEIVDDWKVALNKGVDEEKLKQTAKAICDGFHSGRTYHPCHRVVLDLSHIPSEEIDDQIPEDAVVVKGDGGTSDFTLSIFGCAGDQRHTWGNLLEKIDGRRELWRTQLDKAFNAARCGDLFDPVSATLRSWKQKRLYKPVLYRIERAYDGATGPDRTRPVEVTIILEHVYAPSPVGDPLFNLIRTHTRLRKEVFEEFQGKFAELAADTEARSHVGDRLLAAIHLIESESDTYGLFDTSSIRVALGDEKVDDFENMKRRWLEASRELRQILGDCSNPAEPTGRPEGQIKENEIARVEELLSDMQTLNRTCSIWATERYLEMLQDKL